MKQEDLSDEEKVIIETSKPVKKPPPAARIKQEEELDIEIKPEIINEPIKKKPAAPKKKKRRRNRYTDCMYEKVRCRTCYNYYGRKDIKTHIRRYHSTDNYFYCDHCPEHTRTKEKLETHLMTVHVKEPTFECEWCKRKFYVHKRMRAHIRKLHLTETGEYVVKKERILKAESYECEKCGKFYSNSKKNNVAEYFWKRHESRCKGKPELQIKVKEKRVYKCRLCENIYETWGGYLFCNKNGFL